jgi:hypothetical protein
MSAMVYAAELIHGRNREPHSFHHHEYLASEFFCVFITQELVFKMVRNWCLFYSLYQLCVSQVGCYEKLEQIVKLCKDRLCCE